ncbi:MAG TPA: ABC transporter permease [Dehalococcoidia bacterium]|nr:ABC transporter permease [Dehalococcoidia bacterium]
MGRYILKRLLLTIPTLLAVTFIVFGLIRFIPGDAAMVQLGETGRVGDEEELDRLRHALGLDKPWYEDYAEWIGGVARGDLGESIWSGRDVRGDILDRLPVTLELAALAVIFSFVIAIPGGIISAARQDSMADYAIRIISILGLSIPAFWIGTLAFVLPPRWWGWSPPVNYTEFLEDPIANLQQFWLPAAILALSLSASTMRITRSSMLEVLRQDYVRTAWAKGLRERSVIVRHALKNAMIPVVTLIGLQFSVLLGGTVIIEQIFSLPGVGRLTLEAILQRDYPLIQGSVLFIATLFVLINLVVDVSYAWLDPRIRFS